MPGSEQPVDAHVKGMADVGGAVMGRGYGKAPAGALGMAGSGPYRFQISMQGGGKYAVIDTQTGQVRYTGTIDGARQAQAQLLQQSGR